MSDVIDVISTRNKTENNQIRANMFDLSFYASVCGFVKLIHELMQNTLPNGEGHSTVSILKYFNDKVCSVSILSQIIY